MGAALATFGVVGGVLALGLYQRWGVTWPRWVPRWHGRPVPRAFPLVAASTAVLALAPTGSGTVLAIAQGNAAHLVQSPYVSFPFWAAALGLATLGYHYRTRPGCRSCGSAPRLPPAR